VTTVTGEVGPGQTTMHRVPYGTQGSQNDVDVTWDGQKAPDGPRIRVYATRVTCPSFVAPGGTGACASIGSMEGTSATGTEADFVQDRVSIVNGRGNPDILGTPAEYLLWVVGDRTRAVRYSMTATWFYGPDC
jgi:hypothetical protein